MDVNNGQRSPHTKLCPLLYYKEYTFGLHTFLVFDTVHNSNVWPNKYFLFLHCIGDYSVLVTPLGKLLSL